MLLSASNTALIKTELDSVFYQNYDAWADAFPERATAETAAIFKPVSIDRGAYVEEIFKGSPMFAKVGETQTIPAFTPSAGNKLTTFVEDFAASVPFSKDFFDDNLHGFYAETIANLARNARVTQSSNAFSIFRGAFTTTLTADGAAFIGTHTLLNGQSYTNKMTAQLSVPALNEALAMMAEQPDQAGVVLGARGSILLVPDRMFVHATQITQSALVADSANNNVNVYRSAWGLTVYTSPYLGANAGGSDTAWFLLAPNHSVTRLVRQGLQTALRSWEYSNDRTYLYQANFRETVYVKDYSGAIGSDGTSVS